LHLTGVGRSRAVEHPLFTAADTNWKAGGTHVRDRRIMVTARKAKEARVAKTEGRVFRILLGTAAFFVVVCLLPTVLVMVIGLIMGTTSAADPWNLLATAPGYPVFHPQAAWLIVLPAVTMFVLSIVTMPMGMGSESAVDRPTLYATSYGMAVLGFLASIAFQDAPDAGVGAPVGLAAAGLLVVAGVLFHVRNFLGSLGWVPRPWQQDLPEPAPARADSLATAVVGGGREARLQVQFDYTAWLQVPAVWPSRFGDWDYPDADDWAISWGAVLGKFSRADPATEARIVADLRTIEAERTEDETRFVYRTAPAELPLMFLSVWQEDARPDRSLEQLLAADAPDGSGPATIEARESRWLAEGIRSLREVSAVDSPAGPALVAQYAWRHAGLDVFVTAGPIAPARRDEMLAAVDAFALATEVLNAAAVS
jgi:hypothetical protein